MKKNMHPSIWANQKSKKVCKGLSREKISDETLFSQLLILKERRDQIASKVKRIRGYVSK